MSMCREDVLVDYEQENVIYLEDDCKLDIQSKDRNPRFGSRYLLKSNYVISHAFL